MRIPEDFKISEEGEGFLEVALTIAFKIAAIVLNFVFHLAYSNFFMLQCTVFFVVPVERAADEQVQADEQNAFERKASKLSFRITEPTLATETQRLYADGNEIVI